MGTYGVTHIKKDKKIIPFSDSYDGYWSGMAQANLVGIKHIPLTILAKLFDNFTARKALSEEETNSFEEPEIDESFNDLSQRKMSNFLSQVGIDTNCNKEAIEWANSVTKGDIRSSITGVVPLLYMNIHPHYGYNYDYADYVIDLDENVFTFTGVELSITLDSIKKTHELNIVYLFDNDFSLIDPNILPEDFNDIEEYLYESEEANKQENIQKMTSIIEAIFAIPLEKLKQYFDEKEKERQQYLDQNTQPLSHHDTSEHLSYSYSLHTAEVSSQQLRKIIFFIQEKSKDPSYTFILDCVEWGLDEHYIQGGIRFKSPEKSQDYEKFSEIMFVLEYSLKQRFNIISGAGIGLNIDADIGLNLNSTEDLILNKSIFSFEELKNLLTENDYQLVTNEGLPYLAYHTYLDEAVSYIISQNGKTNSPVFWTFVALVAQNKLLFDIVYNKAQEQLNTFEVDDQNRIQQLYLNSYYDGVLLSEILQKQSRFAEDIKSTSLFSDCLHILNDMEKQTLLN